jgi:hypothetical protein
MKWKKFMLSNYKRTNESTESGRHGYKEVDRVQDTIVFYGRLGPFVILFRNFD